MEGLFFFIFYGIRHPVFIISIVVSIILNKKFLSKRITKFKLLFNLFYAVIVLVISLFLTYISFFSAEYLGDYIDYGIKVEKQSSYGYFKKKDINIDEVVSDVEDEFKKSILSPFSGFSNDDFVINSLNKKYSSDKLEFMLKKSFHGKDIEKRLVHIVYDGNNIKALKVPIIVDKNNLSKDSLSTARGTSSHNALKTKNFKLNLLERPISFEEKNNIERVKIQIEPYEIIAVYDDDISKSEPIKYMIKNKNEITINKSNENNALIDLLKEGYAKRYNSEDVYDIKINKVVNYGNDYSGSIDIYWKNKSKTPFNFCIKGFVETNTSASGDVRILIGIEDAENLKSDYLILENVYI